MTKTILELIRRTSTKLSSDVLEALKKAYQSEEPGSPAKNNLEVILNNIEIAEKTSRPICQDTGMLNFFVSIPIGYNPDPLIKAIKDATVTATKKGYLRENSVDSVTGKNTGTNLGKDTPQIHIELDPNLKDTIEISLMLKGGGSENVSTQYSLPMFLPEFGILAPRGLDGVKKVALYAVWKAQGKGCAPGILGICIGSDRANGYYVAKKQLLRRLDDTNPDPKLAELEQEILEEANKLGIGPMGLGGKTTLLGVKIADRNRLPASYFVSIAYGCWAHRRKHLTMKLDGTPISWIE